MKRRLELLVPILLVLVSTVCGGPGSPAGGSRSIEGSFYELQVTHRLEAEGLILDAGSWRESDFRVVEDGRRYLLSFSDDDQSFALQGLSGEDTLTGHLELSGALPADVDAGACSHYVVDEGAFAGGRLLVYRRDAGLRAELTIYGSGLPVLFSERGDLVEV